MDRPNRVTDLGWSSRQMHRYGGLFLSPFVVVFAVSAILINHGWRGGDKPQPTRRQMSIQAAEGLKGLPLARDILRQTGVSGEVEFFPADAAGPRIWIPVGTPTRKTTIDADLSKGTASIEERPISLGEGLIYLHKSPGPHNAAIRGNALFMRIWRVLADGMAYLLLLVSITGIYLWVLVKSERRSGLLALGIGCAAFAAILIALVL